MSIPARTPTRHRVIPEIDRKPIKADLRKPESEDALKELGECLDFARRAVGWNLEQLAGAMDRDPRQVQRWIDGKERVQIDTVFRVPQLRQPLVIALARLSQEFDEDVTLTARRRA